MVSLLHKNILYSIEANFILLKVSFKHLFIVTFFVLNKSFMKRKKLIYYTIDFPIFINLAFVSDNLKILYLKIGISRSIFELDQRRYRGKYKEIASKEERI